MANGNVLLPSAAQQPSLKPVITLTGTSVNYGNLTSEVFVAANQTLGYIYHRSNGGVAMSDTLPNPQFRQGNQDVLPNGWNISVLNTDATSSITITPAGVLINLTLSLTIDAGDFAYIWTDGINYFATIII